MQILRDIYSVGALNPNLRVFDIVMRTEYGTSYNSYLVRGEKTALIETCHDTFFDAYVENIRAVCDPSEVDYIILNHTEPDHSGVLSRLLDIMPHAQIFCFSGGVDIFKEHYQPPDFKAHAVKDGETLDLGQGRVLTFIPAPFLHWPDSMFTYLASEKVLFSCDFFGSHYCEPLMLDTHISYPQAYFSALRNYYDAIFGPFKPYVLKGLEKISDLAIEMCCPSHGPILTEKGLLSKVRENYSQWSQPHKNEKRTVAVFYCTAYGNTGRVANAIREGFLSVLPDTEMTLYNIIDHDMAQLADALHHCDAFLIGSPTLNRDAVPPVWNLLAHVDAVNMQKRPVAVFGSYGWSGEAVPAIVNRLQTLKLSVFPETMRVIFVPSEEELQKAREFGAAFAKSLQ